MPTYIYRCSDGHIQERDYRFSEEKPEYISCHCKLKAKRQFTGITPIFKGPGFTKSNE